MTMQLQGIGKREAVPANSIEIGDVMVWNFGYQETVKNIEFSKTGKTMNVTIICESGQELVRKMKADRLVSLA